MDLVMVTSISDASPQADASVHSTSDDSMISITQSVLLGERPIDRVPAEILLHIFKMFWALPSSSNREDPWDWLAITSSCRRWRDTALSTPSLWTEINNFHGLDMARTILERSQSFDITLELSGESRLLPFNPELVEMILPHIWRVTKMNVNFKREEDWRHFEAMLSRASSLSKVKYLTLHKNNSPVVTLALPHLPQVSTLDLKCIHIPFNSAIFHGLRRLCINRLSVHRHPVPLLDLLKLCKNIQSLSLNDVNLVSSDRPVHLPACLEELSLTRIHFDSCYETLSRMVIRSPISFTISYVNYRLDSLRTLIPDSIGQGALEETDSSALSVGVGWLRLDLCRNKPQSVGLEYKYDQFDPEDGVGEEYMSRYTIADMLECLSSILRQPYIRNTRVTAVTMDLLHSSKMTKSVWLDLFVHAHHVRVLKITFDESSLEKSSNEFVYALVDSFCAEIVSSDLEGEETVYQKQINHCPNLEDLYLHSFTPGSEELYRRFVEYMKSRVEYGKRLRQLSIGAGALRFGDEEEEKKELEVSGIADHIEILPALSPRSTF